MSQKILPIKIEELVLWTENPRDPIDSNASDQDIVNKAISDNRSKWSLQKLAKEMGPFYDLSELPTVVYIDNKPVVYDGNRRIILAKIKHGHVSIGDYSIDIPDIPKEVPCNVCSEEVALQNVYRKHADSGSWDPLERDIFLHKFMHKPKSRFLLFEESTNGFISSHSEMNKRFVRDEILTDASLTDMGFSFVKEELHTSLSKEELAVLLNDLLNKITEKKISTRTNRGDILGVLDTRTRQIIEKNKGNTPRKIDEFKVNAQTPPSQGVKAVTPRVTRRTKSKTTPLFGGPLYLKSGDINNLYRDICKIYEYYDTHQKEFTDAFISLIRMALRLLCESAQRDLKIDELSRYISTYAPQAKKALSKDYKTFLANHNVSEKTMLQLLHTGAHNYSASKSLEQAIGTSILLGAMLTISHGKN